MFRDWVAVALDELFFPVSFFIIIPDVSACLMMGYHVVSRQVVSGVDVMHFLLRGGAGELDGIRVC